MPPAKPKIQREAFMVSLISGQIVSTVKEEETRQTRDRLLPYFSFLSSPAMCVNSLLPVLAPNICIVHNAIVPEMIA